MKEPLLVLDEVFNQLLANIEQGKLRQCYRISSECVRFNELLDFDKGVYIFEIFESVFSQIGLIFEDFKLPEELSKQMSDDLYNYIKEIRPYINLESTEYLLALQRMRVSATKFQLYCFRNYNTSE
jgi:hypothetical protein